MYCTECGAKIPDDAKFCPFCSKPVITGERRPISPPPMQPYQGVPLAKSHSNRATGVLILTVIIFLITGVLLIYFGITTIDSSPTTGITMLVIGIIIIIILCGVLCGIGGGDCSGCDCSGCDCDCGDCAS
jgi:hypothetical protein